MEFDERKLEEVLRRIIEVERALLYGPKTGSASARRGEVERELNRVLSEVWTVQNPDGASR